MSANGQNGTKQGDARNQEIDLRRRNEGMKRGGDGGEELL